MIGTTVGTGLQYFTRALSFNVMADNSRMTGFDPVDAQIAFGLLMTLIILFTLDLKKGGNWEVFIEEHVAFIAIFVPLTLAMVVLMYFKEEVNQNFKTYYNRFIEFTRVYLLMFLGFASTHESLFNSIMKSPVVIIFLLILAVMVYIGPYEVQNAWGPRRFFGSLFTTAKSTAAFQAGRQM